MHGTFLKRHNANIVDGHGNPVYLRGVSFGGWLMMESYFLGGPNLPQSIFEKEFVQLRGKKALNELFMKFRSNFITEFDFKQVASWGMNCIRLPFDYKIADNDRDIAYLDQAIAWARKYNVYLILDLHATYGAQNCEWHAGSSNGKAELWTKESNRKKTYALWKKLADRYKDETIIAGYDILNESVLENTALLNEFYRECIKAIRRVDKHHILFIEGTFWAQQIDVLDDFADDNWAYSIHYYEPMEFAYNLIPFLRYPLPAFGADEIRRRMEGYFRYTQKKKRPVYVGEFGINYRQGFYNEHIYLRDMLQSFKEFGFHWSYWTYKAVKHHMFPDGVYSYFPNSPWVYRQGPKTGWYSWGKVWSERKDEMVCSWRTKAFDLNTHVVDQLKKAL